MRNVRRRHHPPRFDLDPVAIALVDDLVGEVNQSDYARVFPRSLSYQQMIYKSSQKSHHGGYSGAPDHVCTPQWGENWVSSH
jgi:hypothetical protein